MDKNIRDLFRLAAEQASALDQLFRAQAETNRMLADSLPNLGDSPRTRLRDRATDLEMQANSFSQTTEKLNALIPKG